MTEIEEITNKTDAEMRAILEELLASDLDITARAVVRLHPALKAASSITRSDTRKKLLAEYQERQQKYRYWRRRAGKQSIENTSNLLAQKELRIAELEANVRLLTASHVAMLRAVGEMGGFRKWAQFFEKHQAVLAELKALHAMPDNIASFPNKENPYFR
ncbi:hypothetical protein [Undibacterium rugosum]|uniref:hypothetical protein n=1 Tax=Undibacterium rugosum TaxID=2762291 RepID=UPI001B814441|nr:hypothetical protein [Undibacterium rugosum]MBR7780250.1 hypothetical protein [Undibacterium rugosum]